MWRALTRPPFNIIPPHALLSAKYLFPFLGIFICLLEFGYPIFIWLRTTSRIWLLLVLLMHIGIAVTMHLELFALTMIILNLAAFGSIFSGYSLARQRT
jgi:drug/metabolite transporter superfamily protein YnfA